MWKSLLAVVLLILSAAQTAQPQRSPKTSAGRLRTLEDIIDDQIRGKTPTDKRITIPATGGRITINNVFRNAKFTRDERYLLYEITDEIDYSAGGGGEHFIITVRGDENALRATELKFIRMLGISKNAACRLRGDVDGIMEYLIGSDGESRYVRSSFSWCST